MDEQTPRTKYDLALMQRLYEESPMPLRALAAEVGCAASMVVQNAKRYGWTRRLAPLMRNRAAQILERGGNPEGVGDEDQPEADQTDPTVRAVIEGGAKELANVQSGHRRIARQLRRVLVRQMKELEGQEEAHMAMQA
jgi:hypothetical protein